MSEREKKEYVCLRCGNVYSSRAKVPQCPICKSRKRLELEKFLALPKEQQEKLLGKSKGQKKAEDTMKVVKSDENAAESSDDSVKFEEKIAKSEEKSVKYEEPQKITAKYDESKSVKYDEVRKNKRERVKRGFSIPKPKLSLKAYAFIGGLAFMYFLYKLGFFESLINHLKTLGVFVKSKPEEEVEHPLLERVRRNLS